MTNKKSKSKSQCGGLSAAAAKYAAFGRDDRRWGSAKRRQRQRQQQKQQQKPMRGSLRCGAKYAPSVEMTGVGVARREDNCKNNSRFPAGMTNKKNMQRQQQEQQQIPCGNDKQEKHATATARTTADSPAGMKNKKNMQRQQQEQQQIPCGNEKQEKHATATARTTADSLRE
jgi:hypothetical protein